MSRQGKEKQKSLLVRIKEECPRIACYGRNFFPLHHDIAGLIPINAGEYRTLDRKIVTALDYFKNGAKLTVEQVAEIYSDIRLEMGGKKEPYELTWKTLDENRSIPMGDTDAWVKLSKALNQEIEVCRGIPPNSYDEFETMYTIYPSGRVRRLGGI